MESNGAAPESLLVFKSNHGQCRSSAKANEAPTGSSSVCVTSTFTDRAKRHKGVPASMIYHLSKQMKAGRRPRIFKHGEQKRDFVYVKDAVEGSIRALDAQTSGIYNLGSGQARSFNELVDVLNKCLATNFQPDYIDNPHAHYQNFTQADLTNARNALGYEPQFSLEKGVRDYMQWLIRETRVTCAIRTRPNRETLFPTAGIRASHYRSLPRAVRRIRCRARSIL